MPWSITLCCTAILLISCRLCRRLLRALNISALSASVFLALVCLAELLPAFAVGQYMLLKPYGMLLMLICASVLLAGASRTAVLRGIAGALPCCLTVLAVMWFVPAEHDPELFAGLAAGFAAFAAGYTADAALTALCLGFVPAELTLSLMYLPFFEIGTGGFLCSASVAAAVALTLSALFAHSPLKEKRRLVDSRLEAMYKKRSCRADNLRQDKDKR